MTPVTPNFLFRRFLQFLNLHSAEEYPPELDTKRKQGSEKETARECAVCFCKIEQGDEIRELRCDHVDFHTVCLERCVAVAGNYKHETCPMCRGSLAPPQKWAAELVGVFGEEEYIEVRFSNLFSSRKSSRRSTWWLI